MPDNPQPAPDRKLHLPGHGVLAIAGRDALAFAQAQFMNDVSALADGQWHWNGWLTPKGRVIALFALLRLDADTLWLLLPDAAAEDLAEKLQRFVFRSKVTLSTIAAPVTGRFIAPVQARGSMFAALHEGDIELDMSGDGGPRSLRIGGDSAPEDGDVLARWTAADLSHGLPRLPVTQTEQWTPQQLSLERLRAFSVKKGCYPGQEIVARTHFLGQAKRGLALFEADAPVAVGATITNSEHGIGTVACTSGTTTLAVLPLERETTTLDANGVALHERPLLGGLAR